MPTASWANTEDRTARTAAARAKALRRFEEQVDPDGVLDPVERAVRAEHARKAYMLKLAMASAKARRLRAQAADIEADLAAEEAGTGSQRGQQGGGERVQLGGRHRGDTQPGQGEHARTVPCSSRRAHRGPAPERCGAGWAGWFSPSRTPGSRSPPPR